jgi:hypothetical protein
MTHVEEGKLAFQLSKPSQNNPYASYSPAWAQWNQGWTCEQLKHAKDQSPAELDIRSWADIRTVALPTGNSSTNWNDAWD